MMLIRSVAASFALASASFALVPLAAAPVSSSTCCSASTECGEDEVCCSGESLGLPDCDGEGPGYCRTNCLPRNGN